MATSEDLQAPPERVTFGTVFEGLFREYNAVLTKRALDRLSDAGVDPRKPLQAGYPSDVWYAAVRILAEEQHPALSFNDATREVGRIFMRGYIQTGMGRPMFAVLRILGPMRSLKRMSRNFRTGDNFTETWLHEDAPGDVRLEINHAVIPAFVQGILETGMEGVGAQESSVELLPISGEHAFYRVRWKA